MQVLVGWDNPTEAETIGLFLNVGDIQAKITTDPEEFENAAAMGVWDVILMALNFPSLEKSFALFTKVRALQPEAPVLGACYQGEVVHLARFMSHGLHNFVTRDANGEFILLLGSVIESANQAVLAQRSKQLAERLREEIESVRQLQESVIPRDIPTPPGYRIAARYEPAQIRVLGDQPVILAGGDYYDIFSMDSKNLILLVGDAAGHGIKACMSIMTMRTLIHMIQDKSYVDTAHFVAEVNQRLASKAIVQDEGGFITMMYCTLNTATHRLQYTSAGHPMPLLHNLRTNEVITLGSEAEAGMPLGIDPNETYHSVSVDMPEDSRLLIFSDGLTDAFPAGGDMYDQFGEKGIIKCLQSARDLSLDEALDKLFVDSQAFTQGSGRHDDTSAVLVERSSSR
jgi:sigma-B regulation protein RsbU (phosphoserine phosphatase)